MTVSVSSIAKLYCLLTGESEQVFANRFSEEEIARLAGNIDHYLSSNDVFSSADVAADASELLPSQVFTGTPGYEKLLAWAVTNFSQIRDETEFYTEIVDWLVAANATVIENDTTLLEAAVDKTAEYFWSLYGSNANLKAAVDAAIADHIATFTGVTAISDALTTAGWTAP